MEIYQTEIQLPACRRGFHLITDRIQQAVSGFGSIERGLCHVLLLHTSASLTLNENADPDVRRDFETFFNRLVPETFSGFRHTSEGSDDMPAHLKSSMLGPSLTIPVTNSRLRLGTWQGIYLCEHRDYGGSRKIVITVMGG